MGIVKIKDKTFKTSIPEAEILKKEIIAYGLSVYQKKWELEEAIKNATTIEEVEVIKW